MVVVAVIIGFLSYRGTKNI